MRLAVVGALVAALGLGACGRKAGLDPPPATAAVPDGTIVVPATAGVDSDGKPIAPATGPKRRIFLDWLLD